MSYLPSQYRIVCISFPKVPISGAPLPADRVTLPIPPGINGWYPNRVSCNYDPAVSGGSLALASFDLVAGIGGVGNSLMNASVNTLSSLTTTGFVQTFAVSGAPSIYTATGITLRQIGSPFAANAGLVNFNVFIEVMS